MRTSFLCFAALVWVAALGSSTQAQILINEFNTGTPDYLELRNVGASSIDLSGWQVATWYATSGSATLTAEPVFTIPAGIVVEGNGYLVLQETGVAGEPGTLPNSIRTGFNYFWTNSRTIEAALYNPGGVGQDYVYLNRFGNPTTPNIPAGQNWIGELSAGPGDDVRRIQDADTDHATDWEKVDEAGTPGGPNPGQNACQFLSLYNVGCPGSGGFTPRATSDSCPTGGDPLAITFSNALGGSVALIFFSTQQASNPIRGSSCNLNLVLVAGGSISLPVGGFGPGGGTLTFVANTPASVSGADITMQGFFLDPEAEIGFSATSGVLLAFQ